MDDTKARRATFSKLSSALAALDDGGLRALLGTREGVRGWGHSQTVEIGGTKVFAKRIPVSDVELENRFSTRNVYDIPSFYNYGVGSAGFGVFRELLAHVTTTNWVLEDAADGFPLMYHHRLLELAEPWGGLSDDQRASYVRFWNGDEGVDRYMRGRADARHELVVLLEHFPFTLSQWLSHNLDRVDDAVAQLFRTVGFLRAENVVHFDAHFANVVTDGDRFSLTDFGLVLDARFQLDERERSFLAGHAHYDYGEVLYAVGLQVAWLLAGLPDEDARRVKEAFGFDASTLPTQATTRIVSRIEELPDVLPVPPAFVDAVVRYRPVIEFVGAFFDTLRTNPRKDTPFDDAGLRVLLEEVGAPLGDAPAKLGG